MSYFNTQMICETCETKEIAHPKYKEAREAENKAVRYGDYNFAGIGLPADLEVKHEKDDYQGRPDNS